VFWWLSGNVACPALGADVQGLDNAALSTIGSQSVDEVWSFA
jgi:hypothetical protein